jgi:hypothetical protein
MTGEVERYRSYGVARQHRRELDAVVRRLELAEAQVIGTAHLTRQAVIEHMKTSRVFEVAVQEAPSGEDEYRLLAVTGAMEMAQEIARVRGRR